MPSLVFSFIISSAGDVVGTTKRILCWSFNFVNDGRFINDKDKIKRLSVEEAPSLFVKKVERFKTVTEIVKVLDSIFSIPSLLKYHTMWYNKYFSISSSPPVKCNIAYYVIITISTSFFLEAFSMRMCTLLVYCLITFTIPWIFLLHVLFKSGFRITHTIVCLSITSIVGIIMNAQFVLKILILNRIHKL